MNNIKDDYNRNAKVLTDGTQMHSLGRTQSTNTLFVFLMVYSIFQNVYQSSHSWAVMFPDKKKKKLFLRFTITTILTYWKKDQGKPLACQRPSFISLMTCVQEINSCFTYHIITIDSFIHYFHETEKFNCVTQKLNFSN